MGRGFQAKRFLIIKSSTELGDSGAPEVAETAAFCKEPTEVLCFSHCGRAETRPNDQDSPQVPLDGAVGAVTSTSSQGQRQARAAWVSPGPHTIMPWRRDTRWLLGRTLPTLSPLRVWNTRVVGLVFTALRLVTC